MEINFIEKLSNILFQFIGEIGLFFALGVVGGEGGSDGGEGGGVVVEVLPRSEANHGDNQIENLE